MSDRINELIIKSQSYDALLTKTKGYGYDSLCLRYKIARDAQMQLELMEDKKLTGGMKQDAIHSRAERDKMRFYEIANDLIGERD